MLNGNERKTGQRKLIPRYIERYQYQLRILILVSSYFISDRLLETPNNFRLTRCHVVIVVLAFGTFQQHQHNIKWRMIV